MPHRDAGFKARLLAAMDDARLRPTALADKLGVHPTSVSRWRRGEIPEAGALSALASALAVRMEWLKTGAGEQKVRERGSEPYGVPEPASGPGRAREFYELVQARMIGKMGTGEPVTASEAAGYLAALWRLAVTECPALTNGPRGDVEGQHAIDAATAAHQQVRSGKDRRQA